ncbi:LOG family protein [Parvularcula lutaonensis]|uniref:Cytokinin riboside 5'-monophosphate phosphoribohydrolase n=1 Tax=Parvularcula lutaonensis TaxID=491923 RepID=A0ABV7MF03_9PROT|nr:TIGR00730 family Rossman fold protein [Parvularcula lutaonensis]GGY52782.1 cytokinin riboside 5'-monophosphate phosphoribohydrolase [Parvularcula lutaonensis]
MNELRSICVYCGSRFGRDDAYAEAAEAVGKTIAGAGLRLVFGGGEQGLMGTAARAARDAGGKVLGIIPTFLQEQEGLLENIESREVKTMHERKIMMFEECEAFAVLPGGIGTLEEMVEMMSWASLALHKKPLVLVNIKGFWDPYIKLIDHICSEGFAYPGLRNAMGVVTDPTEVVEKAKSMMKPSLETV